MFYELIQLATKYVSLVLFCYSNVYMINFGIFVIKKNRRKQKNGKQDILPDVVHVSTANDFWLEIYKCAFRWAHFDVGCCLLSAQMSDNFYFDG